MLEQDQKRLSGMVDRSDTVALTGTVESIGFHNPESGFCVLRVRTRDDWEPAAVVGQALRVNVGEWVEARGRWVTDKRHGRQFKADELRLKPPGTRAGILRYLSSGLVEGIGPHLAKTLVRAFGEQVFEVIEQQPERLLELPGIGRKRQQRVLRAWREQHGVRDIVVFLQSHGVGTARAVRIYKTYGDQAIERVRENPYRLALDISGIGFQTADQLANRLGIARDAPVRIQAGVRHLLWQGAAAGHCADWRDELTARASAWLGASAVAVDAALANELEAERLIKETVAGRELLFLTHLHRAELGVARHIRRLREGRLPWGILGGTLDVDQAWPWVEQRAGLILATSQRAAIAAVLDNKVSIITGGPGVGKTTVVNALLLMLRAKRISIRLCAPTGRAAKRLAETTGQEAKTIHRLLEYDPRRQGFKHDAREPLDTDLVVCDEASMVDVSLMHKLVQALPDHAALLLVGDVDQLPSVGPGAVLADLIASGAVTTVRLREIFRQGQSSRIVLNAHWVNAGQLPEVPEPQPPDGDFFLIRCEKPPQIGERLLRTVTERIPQRFGLDPLQDIQVLTPMNRGDLGTRALNASLQRALNGAAEPRVERFGWVFAPGDKVIQTVNNYDKEVFNGDIGRILSIDTDARDLRVAFDGRVLIYEFGELDELALAYAISVHKAQGSEYPAVVIPLSNQHFMMLRRNLLYTGMTRGKRLVVLIAQPQALSMAAEQTGEARLTRLAARLTSKVPDVPEDQFVQFSPTAQQSNPTGESGECVS
ncbi:helicase, putative, RecD/TraA family [Thiorhodovibrio frisius]|uniref:ATP-dependent RecD2 DNA helicase n=2 Tax=Thiorhodovibrio frisius TaxID=631362 RepID=H8YXY7_9GAMM|nr:helicase, putative, RecD/TraA family [Thiorhodovibrio frisius]WPL23607.1 Exodeoxyribonuclease V alpha chain [Thiorhodovibrio frisius]